MHKTPDILKRILEHKHQEIQTIKQKIPREQLQQTIANAPKIRPFVAAIAKQIADGKAAVIAEIKKASPSKGVIRKNFNPTTIAKSYQQGGATCLSVLTDNKFFQGSDEYLQQTRKACQLPILRKDFIIDPYQIYQSRVIGADCILLIVAALDTAKLKNLALLAQELGLDTLVEVHNNDELEQAVTLNTKLIGINNRDLHTFETNIDTTLHLIKAIPKDKIVVTESGIHTKKDIQMLRQNNINAFLIGEAFMQAEDPGKKLAELFEQVYKA